MTALDAYLAEQPDRCQHGYHLTLQHPDLCDCQPPAEWPLFVAALRRAKRVDGTVHVNDVRPLIRGRIAPKHIGTLYRRAVAEGLLETIPGGSGWEPSTDVVGRNSDKMSRVWKWLA